MMIFKMSLTGGEKTKKTGFLRTYSFYKPFLLNLKEALFTLGLIAFSLLIINFPAQMAQIAYGQALPLPSSSSYGIPNVTPTAPGVSAQQQFYNLVAAAISNVRYVIGAVAIAMMVYAGVHMVIAQGKEEEYTKQRHTIMWAIVGLALVGMSGELVRIFSVSCDVQIPGQPCTPGGFLKDPNAILRSATLFNQRTQFIITFLKYFIGSIAILFIVRSGIRMIVMGSQEDKIALDKKNMIYGTIGLLLIILADTAINKVFYKVDVSRYPSVGGVQPGIDPVRGVKEIAGFTNMVVSILSPIAVLMLLAGAVMYITAGGNDEKQATAKRLIFATIIGIIIIYGAFGIVSTFVSGKFEGGALQITQPTTK